MFDEDKQNTKTNEPRTNDEPKHARGRGSRKVAANALRETLLISKHQHAGPSYSHKRLHGF